MFKIPFVSSIFDMVGSALLPVQDLSDKIFGWNKPATAPLATNDVPPPPPPPTPLNPEVQAKLNETEEDITKRVSKGRASTILNTSRGLLKGPIYAKRSLMGI